MCPRPVGAVPVPGREQRRPAGCAAEVRLSDQVWGAGGEARTRPRPASEIEVLGSNAL